MAHEVYGTMLDQESGTLIQPPPAPAPFSDGEFVTMLTHGTKDEFATAIRQIILRKFADLALTARTALMPQEPARCGVALSLLASARDAALESISE